MRYQAALHPESPEVYQGRPGASLSQIIHVYETDSSSADLSIQSMHVEELQ
jgi:hypothetical protein